MPKDDHDSKSMTLGEALTSNVKLALGKFLLVFPTQPMQVVMRHQQAALAETENSRVLSARQAATEIYKKNGSYAALMKGFGPAGGKEAFKSITYKGTCIAGAPKLSNKILSSFSAPLSPLQHHTIESIMAGSIAASADVVFGGGFEAWAVHSATAHGKNSKSFLEEVKSAGSLSKQLNRVYLGGCISFVKGQVAYTTYFISDKPIKNAVMQWYDVNETSKLPWDGKCVAALLSGASVASFSSIFDIVKTNKQKLNPTKETSKEALYNIYNKFGLKGATAGLPLKFLMITLGWGMTNFALSPHHSSKAKNKKTDETLKEEAENRMLRPGKM